MERAKLYVRKHLTTFSVIPLCKIRTNVITLTGFMYAHARVFIFVFEHIHTHVYISPNPVTC